MARQSSILTSSKVQEITSPGRYGDGGGLYLLVAKGGTKSWLFRFKHGGKLRDLGLGSLQTVSLAEARTRAAEARTLVARGGDPIEDKRKAEIAAREATTKADGTPAFGAFADGLIADIAHGFRNEKHVAQWKMTLGDTYCAAIRKKPIDTVTTDDVLNVLRPIWTTKAETAGRIRGRIERVMDAAKAKGLRSGENPARWKGHLDALLPKRTKLNRGHHAAMPYTEVPAFITRLREVPGMSAKALEFAILTAARSGEVYGARWHEIDMESRVWTVPAKRMKAGREHRVPLTDAALGILTELRRTIEESCLGAGHVDPDDLIFHGRSVVKPLSVMAMAMCMRHNDAGNFTVHGFRSAFRDWVGEETPYARELAEAALAHVVGDAVERAYRRGDALEKRRTVMQAWDEYLNNKNQQIVE